MTTTTKTSTSATAVFARGLAKAAFTQLTGCSVTRSGTTATLTKTTHGLLANDIIYIAGFYPEEYNGVFTVLTVPTADTLTYTIAQDPGANGAGSTGTVDKAVVSSALDNRTGFGALLTVMLQNTTTGPTVAPTVAIGYADADTEATYFWAPLSQGHTVANTPTPITAEISSHARYWKVAIWGNTGQAIDYWAYAYVTASLATA